MKFRVFFWDENNPSTFHSWLDLARLLVNLVSWAKSRWVFHFDIVWLALIPVTAQKWCSIHQIVCSKEHQKFGIWGSMAGLGKRFGLERPDVFSKCHRKQLTQHHGQAYKSEVTKWAPQNLQEGTRKAQSLWKAQHTTRIKHATTRDHTMSAKNLLRVIPAMVSGTFSDIPLDVYTVSWHIIIYVHVYNINIYIYIYIFTHIYIYTFIYIYIYILHLILHTFWHTTRIYLTYPAFHSISSRIAGIWHSIWLIFWHSIWHSIWRYIYIYHPYDIYSDIYLAFFT